jgi:hypothetical protein
MGSLRFADVQTRPTEVLDLTSLTIDEFQRLVPPFEGAFQAHMTAWRLDGQPRTTRRILHGHHQDFLAWNVRQLSQHDRRDVRLLSHHRARYEGKPKPCIGRPLHR